ncbi:pilus assembly protein [Herbaspirillum rubrisubalbicans]|uniref:pilus assembly protein n=1 Tax=Herbaspirillum rubrisubalbicans TaxID=80842 RepID=UPI0015C56438|nr:pilus assembly protein [Herbaspirillum rubrisubalbicans]NQE50945.1 pilus assembly protein [Herbaspirillum rubrisubalbicans]
MSCGFDFSRSPAQRRRIRERNFYRALSAAVLLGCLLALLPGARIFLHTRSFQEANALLRQALHKLAPQVQQAAALRKRIEALEKQLAAQQQLTLRRQQAGLLLRSTAQAAQAANSPLRLQRLLLQADRAELRGQAANAQELRDFTNALAGAGLEGATLNDLQAEDGAYAFSLIIPLAPPPAAARGATP